jgi:uncharacterized protein YceK
MTTEQTTMARRGLLLLVLATAFALGGCAAIRRHEARDTGDLLVAAGFTVKPADTPEQAQELRAMRPLKMVSQPKDGSIIYRFADPYSCQCLYVGDQQAYAEYKRLAEERLEATEAEENATMGWGFSGQQWWW